MAAQIPSLIPIQAFEHVRNRIAEILADEVTNQFVLGGEPALNVTKFWLERSVPLDKSEIPTINVSIGSLTLENQNVVDTDNNIVFYVDCYQSATTNENQGGDVLAKLKLHRMVGVVRAILENDRYKTLGFAPPYIMNKRVASVEFAPVDSMDALSTSIGRVMVTARVSEVSELHVPVIAAGFDTSVKLELTDKGYMYKVNED